MSLLLWDQFLFSCSLDNTVKVRKVSYIYMVVSFWIYMVKVRKVSYIDMVNEWVGLVSFFSSL
jgi:hypothetical protein